MWASKARLIAASRLIGMLGVALIVLRSPAQLNMLGVIAGRAATAPMALGVVLAKRWSQPPEVSAVGYAGWLLTAGGLVLLPIALIAESVPSSIDIPAISVYLWLGAGGGLIAYTLWFQTRAGRDRWAPNHLWTPGAASLR